MGNRTVMLKGPFTDDELRELVTLVANIESRRPAESFYMTVDAPDVEEEMDAFIAKINPQRPGYERITIQRPLTDEERESRG